MATLYLSIGRVGSRGLGGSDVAVYAGTVRGEALTTNTATAADFTATGSSTEGGAEVAEFYSDAAHRISVKGDASATNGIYLPAGTSRWMEVPAGGSISAIEIA